MSVELVVWGLLPIVIGAGAALASLYSVARRPSAFQVAAALVAVTGLAWSEWVLYRIVRGAWPTFVPHVVITLLLPLVFVQVWRASAKAA
jgi:hypothetical protein